MFVVMELFGVYNNSWKAEGVSQGLIALDVTAREPECNTQDSCQATCDCMSLQLQHLGQGAGRRGGNLGSSLAR